MYGRAVALPKCDAGTLFDIVNMIETGTDLFRVGTGLEKPHFSAWRKLGSFPRFFLMLLKNNSF
mgnify:FL=1